MSTPCNLGCSGCLHPFTGTLLGGSPQLWGCRGAFLRHPLCHPETPQVRLEGGCRVGGPLQHLDTGKAHGGVPKDAVGTQGWL